MRNLVFVACGGAMGAVGRFLLSSAVGGWLSQQKFPWGTLLVNLVGCFIAGIIAGLWQRHAQWNPEVRLFLIVGVLGGFTTFSAFGLETISLIDKQEYGLAGIYVMMSVLGGLLLVGLGGKIALAGSP